MTESEAIEKLKNMRLYMQIEDKNNDCKFTEDDYKANEMAINALEKQIAKKHDEYVPELDDEIKLPYKISKLEAKAIEVALYHQWFRITDVNGKATSCSQEMADATYKMLCLFDKLIKDSEYTTKDDLINKG